MGDVGSAVVTPFVAVGTTLTGQAHKKIYYDCPRCGDEVWVYGAGAAFVGRKCVDCRGKSGPIDLGIVGDAVDVAVTPVTAVAAIVTGNANEKVWYNCPKCHERKWVSAMAPHFKGKICFECKSFGMVAKTAEFCGSTIYQQWGQDSDKDYSYKINLNDAISWYETRACRILHGSISWLANAIGQSATLGQADLIDHWWVVIKTKQGKYYQLQFRGLGLLFNDNGKIALRLCESSKDCDLNGLAEAAKGWDAHVFEQSSYSDSGNGYTIGDVVKWMKGHNFSAKYSVTSHNCQDLCKAFYRKF